MGLTWVTASVYYVGERDKKQTDECYIVVRIDEPGEGIVTSSGEASVRTF